MGEVGVDRAEDHASFEVAGKLSGEGCRLLGGQAVLLDECEAGSSLSEACRMGGSIGEIFDLDDSMALLGWGSFLAVDVGPTGGCWGLDGSCCT